MTNDDNLILLTMACKSLHTSYQSLLSRMKSLDIPTIIINNRHYISSKNLEKCRIKKKLKPCPDHIYNKITTHLRFIDSCYPQKDFCVEDRDDTDDEFLDRISRTFKD